MVPRRVGTSGLRLPAAAPVFFSGYEKHEGDCPLTPPRALARAAGFSTEFSSLRTGKRATRSTPTDDDEHAVV